MKITRSYLQQIIKEEAQQELFKTNVNDSAVINEVRYKPCKTPATGIGLKKGCRGENVEVLQRILELAHQTLWKEEFPEEKVNKIEAENRAVGQVAKKWVGKKQGFVKPDGFFGPQTEIAVLGIQILSDLQDTGLIDKNTFLVINKLAQQTRPGAFRVARAATTMKTKTIAGALPTDVFGDETGYAARLTGKK